MNGAGESPTSARHHQRLDPLGARLDALLSSDIGHFDVPDMAEVVPEAYELVEHGLLARAR